MARITRLGPAGISMRTTTFTGVPAAPRDPFPVAVSRGGFLDVKPRIILVEPVKILLEDRLIVITRDRIISPPQVFENPVTVQLLDHLLVISDEIFEDGADRRRAKRMALKWFGLSKPDGDDPFGVFNF